jgi:aldose 1-epimerase
MTMQAVLPSGEQYEIAHGEQRAVVVSVGGGLRTYESGGAPVLDGYDVDAMADGARAQTLVPWANRIQDGKWTWEGEPMQLALTEPEQNTAIHGLVRWMPFHLVEHSASHVAVSCMSYPQPGYPWPLHVRNDVTLADDGLTMRTSVTNAGAAAAPVAAGSHPYITVGTPTVDTAVLHLPAETWLPTGDQQIPTGREVVAGSPYDFRTARPIGDVEIDYTYTDLHRDADGRFRLRLEAPDGRRAVTFWIGPAYDYVEIFTGHALPDEGRRRRGLGVEPMTTPPNGLVTGDGVVVLEPGATWVGEWGISPE